MDFYRANNSPSWGAAVEGAVYVEDVLYGMCCDALAVPSDEHTPLSEIAV
jgi:hypothetical protein